MIRGQLASPVVLTGNAQLSRGVAHFVFPEGVPLNPVFTRTGHLTLGLGSDPLHSQRRQVPLRTGDIERPGMVCETQLGVLMNAKLLAVGVQISTPASVEFLRNRDFQHLVRIRWPSAWCRSRRLKTVLALLTQRRAWKQSQEYRQRRSR